MRITRRVRRYDEKRGCYVYDISFTGKPQQTERSLGVAEAFGLDPGGGEQSLYRDFSVRLAPGDVCLITGESGGGKSVLLRALRADLGAEAADIDEVQLDPGRPVVDQVGASLPEALRLLARVGLGDALLAVKTPRELSEGQRYRLRAAKLLESGRRFWVADEFCSILDRDTARGVAYSLQRQAREAGAALIAATAHGDLVDDLDPSVLIRKGWGLEASVEYRSPTAHRPCSLLAEVEVTPGSRDDYLKLSAFHYRSGHLPAPLAIYAAKHGAETVGVIVYSYPGLQAKGRREAAGYTPRVSELNREWATITRVVVHPRLRGVGLASRLIRETLPLTGRRHVELIAAMAEYTPFAERAGMRLVERTTPDPSVAGAVRLLAEAGFNPRLLSSERANADAIRRLGAEEAVRGILLGVKPYYYRRLMGARTPHTRRGAFEAWLRGQPAGRLARSLAVLAVLGQPKCYLYWRRGG